MPPEKINIARNLKIVTKSVRVASTNATIYQFCIQFSSELAPTLVPLLSCTASFMSR